MTRIPVHGLVAWSIALLCMVAGCSASPPPDRLVDGQPFPAVTLTDVDGKQVEFSAWRGKLVVLNIWATWCAPCRKELPSLQRLSQSLDARRYAVIGLAMDEDEHVVREYLIDKGVTYVNFLDKDMRIVKEVFGLSAYPDTLIIAPDGTLLGRIVGAADWDAPQVIKALEEAYHGNTASLRELPHAS